MYRKITASFRDTPNVLIIGAQKCGTSSLFEYLKQHHDVATSNVKEVHFFDENFNKGVGWYKRHFPFKWKSGKVTVEATPYYLFHPLVAERIHRTLGNVTLIVLLRNPVDRAYSHFQMAITDGYETSTSFKDALELEESRLDGIYEQFKNDSDYRSDVYKNHGYVSRGKYVDQIQLYLKYFDRNKILILNSEEFFKNPWAIMADVYEFLELSPVHLNFNLLNKQDYDSMNGEVRLKLLELFKPYNKRLFELLGVEYDWND